MKFNICRKCGNIVFYLKDNGVPLTCCGEAMPALTPNTTDAAAEKHVPVMKIDGNRVTVSVGTAEHPMLDEHSIEWIVLDTAEGSQIKFLKPGKKPEAEFMLTENDRAVAAYEYCNLHGLWKHENSN